MFWSVSKVKLLFYSSLALLLSLGYYQYLLLGENARLKGTLRNLLRVEAHFPRLNEARVAVGFGSCQDVIVQSSEVMPDVPLQRDDKPPEGPITTLETLLRVFAFFFKHGAAAERYIHNSSLLEELIRASEGATSKRWSMGGNAPVMASRFAQEGCKVLLGAQMSPLLKEQLPASVKVSGPETREDDVHLLLEYPAGMEWGPYTAPRANRLIVHSDLQNPLLSSLEVFSNDLERFDADLLVIGGLQMMDNFPFPDKSVRDARILKVENLLESQPPTTRIHFELASFDEEELFTQLVNHIVPHADSLGMNEQELPLLAQFLKKGRVTRVSDAYPRVATVLDQMRNVFQALGEQKNSNDRPLTRLHVHTLAFQAIMTVKTGPWKNTMAAAAKAVLTAHRHTCGSEDIMTSRAKLLMDDSFSTSQEGARRLEFNAERPVACWEEGRFEICVAPGLVCTEVRQTGGGGDNISSASLALQI